MGIKSFNHDGLFLIALTGKGSWNEIESAVERILVNCWSLSIANAYVIAIVDGAAKLYTFFPYNENNCGSANAIVVNEYRNNTFVPALNVFVDKFENMHKCNLSVVTNNFRPLIFVAIDDTGKRYLDGIEGNIMNYLARVMNFTVDIKAVPFDSKYRANALSMV